MTDDQQPNGPDGSSIGGPTTATWRGHALKQIAEQRYLTAALLDHNHGDNAVASQTVTAIMGHLDAAQGAAAADPRRGWWARTSSALGGASVERAMSHLDAADTDLLRAAPDAYLRGQLPSVQVLVEAHLPRGDARRRRVEQIARRGGQKDLEAEDRNAILAAVRAASTEARLSALDTYAQIISWAIVFGFSQQLLTQFADRQAQGILEDVSGPGDRGARDGRGEDDE
jgi:hypothetical protein